MKRETFKAAHTRIFAELATLGWTVRTTTAQGGRLVEPKATHPGVLDPLVFRLQAAYHRGLSVCSDVRDSTGGQLDAAARRQNRTGVAMATASGTLETSLPGPPDPWFAFKDEVLKMQHMPNPPKIEHLSAHAKVTGHPRAIFDKDRAEVARAWEEADKRLKLLESQLAAGWQEGLTLDLSRFADLEMDLTGDCEAGTELVRRFALLPDAPAWFKEWAVTEFGVTP